MGHHRYAIHFAVAKQFQVRSVDFVQLATAEFLDLLHESVKGFSYLTQCVNVDTELLLIMKVEASHEDDIFFCKVRQLAFGRRSSKLLRVLG